MSLNTDAEARSLWMLWWYFIHNTCKYNSTCDVSRNTETRSCNWKEMCYIFWVCVCGIIYPKRNTHAPYWQIWPFVHQIFFYIISQSAQFLRKCIFLFSLQIFPEKFLNLKDMKCIFLFMKITLYSCQILMSTEFSRQIFEAYSC